MDTIIITSKSKTTSALLKKLLKEMKGIERVTTLSKAEKEDVALINAIQKGHTKKYVDTNAFLKKLERK
jgi:predicted solute-binding protein